jgi:hypothetical protein
MKSGNLNFLEPSGSLQASNGTALKVTHVTKSTVTLTANTPFAKLRVTINLQLIILNFPFYCAPCEVLLNE